MNYLMMTTGIRCGKITDVKMMMNHILENSITKNLILSI